MTTPVPLQRRLQPGSAHLEDGAKQLRLLSNLRKHWLLVGTVAVCVTVGAAFYTVGQRKTYRSTATLLIDPAAPRPLGQDVQGVMDLGTGMYWNNREYYETQYRIMRSRAIALQTVRQLGLDRDVRFIQNLAPNETPQERLDAEGEPLPWPTEALTARMVLGRLGVEPIKESRLVEVSFDAADPEQARRILDALIQIYLSENIDRALESTKNAGEWLEVQLERLKTELTDSEMALHHYKRDQKILSVSMDDQSNMLREEMQQLNSELTRVRVEAQNLKARYKQLTSINRDDPSQLPSKELLDSPVLATLRAAYAQAQNEVRALRAGGKGENHPDYRGAEAREQSSRAALLDEVTNITSALGRSLKSKNAEAGGLSVLFDKAKERALELNRLEVEYRRLERTKSNTEKLYSLVLERTKESGLTQMMRFNNITIVDPPELPRAPIKPVLALNVAAGGLAGLLLGLAGAFLRVVSDRTIKSPEDLEEHLGVTFLGLLPRSGSRGGGYGKRKRRKSTPKTAPELVVHHEPQSNLAEAARAIRTNLMFIAPDRPLRRILVTSGGPSEGKTTVACNIAVAMAQAGLRVLLVDCDLRRPRVHRVFDILNDSGVSTALLDDTSLDFDSLGTIVPNLSVLPSGPPVPNPAETLHSERFAKLLNRLSEHFDRVVLDSPPVVAVTDAAVLSTQVDGTVFVVRGGFTRRELALQTLRTLEDVSARLLGVVLNGADLSKGRYGGYYYHYDYYGRTPSDKDSRPPSARAAS